MKTDPEESLGYDNATKRPTHRCEHCGRSANELEAGNWLSRINPGEVPARWICARHHKVACSAKRPSDNLVKVRKRIQKDFQGVGEGCQKAREALDAVACSASPENEQYLWMQLEDARREREEARKRLEEVIKGLHEIKHYAHMNGASLIGLKIFHLIYPENAIGEARADSASLPKPPTQ